MVYTALLPRTLQGVTKAVKGPATHRQGRWRQRPPCHSPSQHHPTPPHQGTKAVAGASVWWPVASAKLCSRLAVAASAHGRVGGTAGRETAHPSLSLEA